MAKFNLYNCTLPKREAVGRYAALSGVYHDNGWKVATDKSLMVAIKTDYDSSLEQRVIRKDKSDAPSNFPAWRKIIPSRSALSLYDRKVKLTKEMSERFDKWYDSINENVNRTTNRYVVRIGTAYYRVYLFKKFYDAIREYGLSTLYVQRMRAAVAKNSECVCMLMPLLFDGWEVKWAEEHCYILNFLNE